MTTLEVWRKVEFNRHTIKKILFIITFTVLLFWVLYHFSTLFSLIRNVTRVLMPFLIGLGFAFIFNVLLRPIEGLWNRAWAKKESYWTKRLKRPVCLLISVAIIGLAIFILIFIITPQITDTATSIIRMLPYYTYQIESWWDQLVAFFGERNIMLPQLELNVTEIGRWASSLLSNNSNVFFDTTIGITTSIFSAVFNVILAIAFSIYILAQKETLTIQIKKIMYAFLPERHVQIILEISDLTNKTFTRFVTGQLTEALIIGFLCFIGMGLMNMPYAPVVAVLVGVTALIPVFGAFIGTAIGAFLILMVEPIKALWFVLFILVLQQVEGNLIYPKVVGKSVGLPSMWVLAAVTIGGNAFGIVGMLLGVPICSVIYSIFKKVVNSRLIAKKENRIPDTAPKEAEEEKEKPLPKEQ